MEKNKSKIFSLFTLVAILIIATLLLLNVQGIKKAQAGTGDNVSGWAWSENIGWISFNNTTGGGGVNYGVNIGSDGIFSGYAWSENIGWISFNQSELSGCPSGTCRAEVNLSNYEVSGWARALSYGDGWEGWIRLRGSNYGVKINDATQEFEGWAWSDMVIGWISFNHLNCDSNGDGVSDQGNYSQCPIGQSVTDYKVKTSFSFNRPPTATNLNATLLDPCIYSLPASFSWEFSDPDAGDTQEYYQVQIDNNSNFSSLEVDSGKVHSSSEAYAPAFSFLYNTRYYWRLMVWDNNDADSGWISGPSFTTPLHRYPDPDFIPSPQNPSVDQVVEFIDSSKCYNAVGSEYLCRNGGGVSYQWDFDYDAEEGFTIDSTYKGNATTTYATSEPYTVRLRITDDIGTCSTDRTVNVTLPLPEWWEIAP